MHYVSYEKLSKKEKRRFDLQRRGSWNGVCPVTKRADSKKLYSRAKVIRETQTIYEGEMR